MVTDGMQQLDLSKRDGPSSDRTDTACDRAGPTIVVTFAPYIVLDGLIDRRGLSPESTTSTEV